MIAISTDFTDSPDLVYRWGLQDVNAARAVWPLLLFALLGGVEFLAFNPCTEGQIIGFWLFMVTTRL